MIRDPKLPPLNSLCFFYDVLGLTNALSACISCLSSSISFLSVSAFASPFSTSFFSSSSRLVFSFSKLMIFCRMSFEAFNTLFFVSFFFWMGLSVSLKALFIFCVSFNRCFPVGCVSVSSFCFALFSVYLIMLCLFKGGWFRMGSPVFKSEDLAFRLCDFGFG